MILKFMEVKRFVWKKLLQAVQSSLAETEQADLSSSSIQQFSHNTMTQL